MIIFSNVLLDKAGHHVGHVHRPAADGGGQHHARCRWWRRGWRGGLLAAEPGRQQLCRRLFLLVGRLQHLHLLLEPGRAAAIIETIVSTGLTLLPSSAPLCARAPGRPAESAPSPGGTVRRCRAAEAPRRHQLELAHLLWLAAGAGGGDGGAVGRDLQRGVRRHRDRAAVAQHRQAGTVVSWPSGPTCSAPARVGLGAVQPPAPPARTCRAPPRRSARPVLCTGPEAPSWPTVDSSA